MREKERGDNKHNWADCGRRETNVYLLIHTRNRAQQVGRTRTWNFYVYPYVATSRAYAICLCIAWRTYAVQYRMRLSWLTCKGKGIVMATQYTAGVLVHIIDHYWSPPAPACQKVEEIGGSLRDGIHLLKWVIVESGGGGRCIIRDGAVVCDSTVFFRRTTEGKEGG